MKRQTNTQKVIFDYSLRATTGRPETTGRNKCLNIDSPSRICNLFVINDTNLKLGMNFITSQTFVIKSDEKNMEKFLSQL